MVIAPIAQRRSYHKKLQHVKQRYDNQKHLPTRPTGTHNKISTPTHGTQTRIRYPNQTWMDSKDLSHDGQIPTTYPFFRQQWLQPHQQDQTTRPIQAEQPRCKEPTSTSGPLIRRRVIIYVEDHTRPGQATDRQTIPHIPKDTMKVTPHK